MAPEYSSKRKDFRNSILPEKAKQNKMLSDGSQHNLSLAASGKRHVL